MFDVCGVLIKCDDGSPIDIYDYYISIGNETFGIKEEWCELIHHNDLSESIKSELLNNPDYKQNLSEILDIYFNGNIDSLVSWGNWFNGK
jgi:hypothetical protein